MAEDAEPSIKDLALITAAKEEEHYEISGYESARSLAEARGNQEVADRLQETPVEEEAADEKPTEGASTIIASVPVEGLNPFRIMLPPWRSGRTPPREEDIFFHSQPPKTLL